MKEDIKQDKSFQYSAYTGPVKQREQLKIDSKEYFKEKSLKNSIKTAILTKGILFG